MATWVDPVDSQTDPDAPLTSALAKRWDNNLIAMAEGAPGSPRVDIRSIGDAYIDAIQLDVPAGQNSFADLMLPFKARSFVLNVGISQGGESGGATKALNVRFSNDNGITWSDLAQLATVRRGQYANKSIIVSNGDYIDGPVLGNFPDFPDGGVNAIRLQSSTVSGSSMNSTLNLGVHILSGA